MVRGAWCEPVALHASPEIAVQHAYVLEDSLQHTCACVIEKPKVSMHGHFW
jgi:hypothetical protein